MWLFDELDYSLVQNFSLAGPWYKVMIDRAHDLGDLVGIDNLSPGDIVLPLTVLAAAAVWVAVRRGRRPSR